MKLITKALEIPSNFTGIAKFGDGTKIHFLNGEPHRENGPAYEYASGTKCWWKNGKLHREDGPAIEFADGTVRYHINGEFFTKEEFDNRKNSCHDKTIEIDGKKYKLTLVEQKL